ncbi:hypothetical protein CHS0354_011300 [Potamilus streckersoni]|nr:hypothetical protein CHS0354_011300 [Potamilus streckersoni]
MANPVVSSASDFLKWKASNHHTAPDFSSISQDNMSNNVHDVLRHGSTGSAGSFRSNGGGSGVNSPTAPNNTPLVIPQPVKPATKAGKTYQCKMCDQIFHTKSDMLIHSQQIHKQDPKPYHCPQCQKCFANSSYLSQHARIHAGIKPYKCEICERKFTQLSHLQQHIRTHTGEKPYKCSHPSCGKAFSQLSNLQSHSRSHMTDKPYRCNSCYKCYADEQSLREHIPKHSDTKHLKTHICKICGKSYTQETYLARHMTKHAQDNNSTPKFPSRQIKQEPLEHSNETDFPHLNDGACTPCPPGKPSSAFMPIPQFGSATGSNNVNYPYGGGLGSNSFTTSLPQISSIAPPRYFPYDPLGFKRSEPTERNLNVSMTTRPENMLANSLLSLQHIKNYASQQMPGFGPTSSGTGASSRI